MKSALPLRHIVAIVMFVPLAGVQSITRAQAPAAGGPVKVTFLTVGRDGRPILGAVREPPGRFVNPLAV